jgi:hypothetical protein
MKPQKLHVILAATSGILLVFLVQTLKTPYPSLAISPYRYVSTTGLDAGNCNSPGAECRTIQYAIDQAEPNDTIMIADGVYTNTGVVAAISKPLNLIGAYDPAFTAPDPDQYTTTLDAQWSGSVVSMTLVSEVMLKYLSLTHGDGSGNCTFAGCGGGIYAYETDLLVSYCVITDNIASVSGSGWGGGLYADRSPIEVLHTRVTSNSATTGPSASGIGGGIYINNPLGSTIIEACDILTNTASQNGVGSGGGLMLSGVSPAHVHENTIQGNVASFDNGSGKGAGIDLEFSDNVHIYDNQINGNRATLHPTIWNGPGAGVYIKNSDSHLTRNIILNNSTGSVGNPDMGGGLYIESSSLVTVSNNLIARNIGSSYGGGVSIGSSGSTSHAYLVNNTIADNSNSGVIAWNNAIVTLENNLIAGHEWGLDFLYPGPSHYVLANTNLFWNTYNPLTGTNAILANPMLLSTYHLREGSPALEAGLTIPWLTVDLEWNTRPKDCYYDLGAYEGIHWEELLPLVFCNYP